MLIYNQEIITEASMLDDRCGINSLVLKQKHILITNSHKYTSCQILAFFQKYEIICM